jgi:hypothetical protein
VPMTAVSAARRVPAWVRKATKHLESSALMTRSFHDERIKMRSLIAHYHDSEPEHHT